VTAEAVAVRAPRGAGVAWEALPALAAGRRTREAHAERIRALLAGGDFEALGRALAARRLLPLLGTRALDVAGDLAPPRFHGAVAQAVARARARGLAVEAATGGALSALERAGVPAISLKGPLLAQDLHGDLGMRDTHDVDVLVERPLLDAARRALEGLGYVPAPGPRHLHVELRHAALPPVDLHWRVHWYESAFSSRLVGAAAPGPDGRPRPRAEDLAAALLLFYARDGLQGLRLPADLAAWWDDRRDAVPPAFLEAMARRHPELAPALTAAAVAVERCAEVPATAWLGGAAARGRSVELAVRLADWAQRGDRDQLAANRSLVNAVLGPRRSLPGFARRELRAGPGLVAHPAKLGARYAVALWRSR
jgi:hypothetical protein